MSNTIVVFADLKVGDRFRALYADGTPGTALFQKVDESCAKRDGTGPYIGFSEDAYVVAL